MSIVSNHSSIEYFGLPFIESDLENWASEQLEILGGEPTFGMLFCSREAMPHVQEILEVVRIYAHVPVILGCLGSGLIAGAQEIEGEAGFTIALYNLPGATAAALHIPPDVLLSGSPTHLRQHLGDRAERANAWMLFASSESLGAEDWLTDWDQATGGKVTVGGFASGCSGSDESVLFYNGSASSEGAVALAIEGAVTIEPIVSHGCRPVGSPWTVTRAENNVIHQIGNRPILEVLRDTLEAMSREEQKQARGNIFVGLVQNEYKANFRVGDFLVRNLAAIDPQTGAVAIATPLRVGQNLQFQIRDAESASLDLEEALESGLRRIGSREIYGACLCDCIGRGSSLFGVPDHDVGVLRNALPGLRPGGVFCNGEFATEKGHTWLHGYAASLGLFVEKE